MQCSMRSARPCRARLKMTAVIIQPTVSSMMADARIIWPTLRRIKFISRITVATIFTEAIDKAVPRNSEVINRLLGSGNMESGKTWPSATPHANGTTMPAREAIADAAPVRRTSLRSVSIPVSSSSISTPNWETASSIAFCSLAAGKMACCHSGSSAPSREGPSTRPAMSWPITPGCLKRIISSPSKRPTNISNASCAMNTNSDGPLCGSPPLAAKAGTALSPHSVSGAHTQKSGRRNSVMRESCPQVCPLSHEQPNARQ